MSSSNFLASGGSRLGDVTEVPDWGKKTDPFTKTSTSTLGRTGSAVVDEKKTHIPGYTGFIRNSKEVAGRSYSRVVERALNKSPDRLAVGDMIPSSPQHTSKVPTSSDDTSSTLVGQYQSKVRHVPGYTGHVPELKHSVGKTYGSATEDLVERPINAKSDRKTLNKATIDLYATRTVTQRPALNLDDSGLYLKYS